MTGKRPPHRVPDERIAEEIAVLDAYLDRTQADPDRRMACMAMGARTALEWIRDSRHADPMNPMRAISLLLCMLDLEPKVLPFTRPDMRGTDGPVGPVGPGPCPSGEPGEVGPAGYEEKGTPS
jgi:hypothetical protein